MTFDQIPSILHLAVSDVPLWLLWLAASVGHGFLLIVMINVVYGWPVPHRVLKFTRKIDLLFVGAGPVLFAWAFGFFGRPGLVWQRPWDLLTVYGLTCACIGMFVAPVAELLYLLRRTPRQQVQSRSKVLDVAKVLGYAPAGMTRRARLCHLPGNQVFQVDFAEKTFVLPRLPQAWDGLTVLHLTDLHFLGTPDRRFYEVVFAECRRWGTPDLLVLTGDVVDSDWHHRWILPLLGRLPARFGRYAILGNHDRIREPRRVRRRLDRAGWKVLGNGWETVDVLGHPLAIIGDERPWFGDSTCREGFRPHAELVDCPAEVFRLLLSHTPDNIAWARGHGVDLMLAGHVHGGQIRLPLLGSVFVPSRFSRGYDCGTFYRAPTLMSVGRGLGGQHPLRFNCLPEVTLIRLRTLVGWQAEQSVQKQQPQLAQRA